MFHDYVQGAGLLRYELLPGETVDEFTLEILRQNTPEGVLLLGRETGEDGDFLLLPVAGLIPLLSDDNSVINKFTKDKFMEEVKTIQASLRDHMIPPDELVLRPEWTWLRPETGKPVLPVLPTPLARDLSLSMDAYEVLVAAICEKSRQAVEENTAAKQASARASAKRRGPAKPWRRVVRDFWENLD